MIRTTLTHALPALAITLLAAGCGQSTSPPENASDEHGGHSEHAAGGGEHEHATTGPHDGSFVELGDHEYLAELVHDEATVTIYLYEHDGTTPAPTDAKDITINLMHDGHPEQFQLAAAPGPNDTEGGSSKFTLENADLAGHLDQESAQPKLDATINGTPYSAPLAHHHDHTGHDHEGHDHEH